MNLSNEKQYDQALEAVNEIMKKGEQNVSETEIARLKKLVQQISLYETDHYAFPKPKDVIELVEIKMFERKMSQTELSHITKIPLPKINQILKRKRPLDISFIKAIHKELNIPADTILNNL